MTDLNHKWRYALVGSSVSPSVVSVGDGTDDDTADRPEHLQDLSGRGTQAHRDNLTAIRRRVGDEDAPGYAFKELASEEEWERVGKEWNKDGRIHEHEANQSRPTVSNTASEWTCKENANERTKLPGHLKRRLPLGRYDIIAGGFIEYTEAVFEGG